MRHKLLYPYIRTEKTVHPWDPRVVKRPAENVYVAGGPERTVLRG